MRITFFIGNGFDLNQNLKTSYVDFLSVYLLEDNKDSPTIKKFKKYLQKYDCWSDLELALGNMLSNYDENSVDDFIIGLADLKENLSQYLSNEEKHFKYKISKIKKELKRSLKIFYTRFGYQFPFNDLYADNSETNEINFVTFNYTHIVNQMISKVRKKRLSLSWRGTENILGTVLSVHGTTKKGFVLGINDISQIGNPSLQNNLKIQKHLIKQPQIETMNMYSRSAKINNYIDNSDIIYVYGMSLGKTDNAYWTSICDWLNKNDKHILIVNHYDGKFIPHNMGAVSEYTDSFRQELETLGAQQKAIINQVYYVTNATIFSFVKKRNPKRKIRTPKHTSKSTSA